MNPYREPRIIPVGTTAQSEPKVEKTFAISKIDEIKFWVKYNTGK